MTEVLDNIRDGLYHLGYDTVINDGILVTIKNGHTHQIPVENIEILMNDKDINMRVVDMVATIKTFHDIIK